MIVENWITDATEDVRQAGEPVTYAECNHGGVTLQYHDQEMHGRDEPEWKVRTFLFGSSHDYAYENTEEVDELTAKEIVMNYGGWDYVE